MEVDLLIHSASQTLTLTGDPQRGSDLGKLGLIEDGAVAIGDEKILAVGSSAELRSAYQAEMEIDATNRVVLPGLVDPHTHLIWAGDRAAEFEMRVAGATYTEIMDAGGGIISTVHPVTVLIHKPNYVCWKRSCVWISEDLWSWRRRSSVPMQYQLSILIAQMNIPTWYATRCCRQ